MTTRFSPRLTATSIAIASILTLSACQKQTSTSTAQAATQPSSGSSLTWGVGTEPSCFDPHSSSQQNAFFLIRNFVDSLVAKLADGSFVPWLAKSWQISDDGKTYTFTLREDVKFSDGTPFNADAVKANFDYIIKNAATTSSSASLLVQYEHIEVLSPTQVKIVLKQPDSTTLESLSSVKLGFLSPKTLNENKDLCAGGPALIGTGPK